MFMCLAGHVYLCMTTWFAITPPIVAISPCKVSALSANVHASVQYTGDSSHSSVSFYTESGLDVRVNTSYVLL